MADINRNGHRKRMRASYIAGGAGSMHDHQLLELLLSLVIPQKDVKPLAYDLINHFGSLENVMNANVRELMKIKGIGESAAVALCLVRDIGVRVNANKNKNIKRLNSVYNSVEYCKNLLCNETVERLLVITLTNDATVINSTFIGEGSASGANINMRELAEIVLNENAANVILAHNHPGGSANPSVQDMDFTTDVCSMLRRLDVNLIDHIIIADDDYYCISQSLDFLSKIS